MTNTALTQTMDAARLDSTARADLLREVRTLQGLADLALEGAEAMTRLSLQAFARARVARDEERANGVGTDLLDCGERLFAKAKALRTEADTLWAKLDAAA